MNEEEFIDFLGEISANPERDIPPSFVDTLYEYERIVCSTSIENIAANYKSLPKLIEKVLENKYICCEPIISHILAKILLKFLFSKERYSQATKIWAAHMLKGLNCSSKRPENREKINSIIKYPDFYFSNLDSRTLSLLAMSSPKEEFIIPVSNELSRRNISIQTNVLNFIDSEGASLRVILKAFQFFVNEPSIFYADKLVNAFKKRPQLHVACTHDLSLFTENQCETALSMIGKSIQKNFPFNFPLRYLYPPITWYLIDEIEYAKFDFHMIPTRDFSFTNPEFYFVFNEFPDLKNINFI